MKRSNFSCCWRRFFPGGLVASFFKVRCMRSWRPFCCGLPGLMRSMPIPKRNHHTESLERPKKAEGLAKGMPLSVRIDKGSPKSLKAPFKHGKCVHLLGGPQSIAAQQVAAGEVGNGQRIAIALIGEHELALVIGAPQIVGSSRIAQHRAFGPVALFAPAADQAVPIQHRMDCANGWKVDRAVQQLDLVPDLLSSPTRVLLLELQDQVLDLKGQTIGVPIRPGECLDFCVMSHTLPERARSSYGEEHNRRIFEGAIG